MSRRKKKKKPQGAPKVSQPAAPQPPAPQPGNPEPAATRDTARLPRPLKALDADYGALLRMRNVRWLIVIAVIVAALWLGYHLSAVFVPLLVALATAYILNPLVVKLQKRGMSRPKAVLLIFLLFIASSAAIGSWMVSSVIADVQSLSTEGKKMVDKLKADQGEWVAAWNEAVPEKMRLDPNDDNFDKVIDEATSRFFPTESSVESPEASQARAQMVTARADLLTGFQRLDRNGDFLLQKDEVGSAELAAMDSGKDGTVSADEWFARFGATVPKADGRTVSDGVVSSADRVVSVVGSGLSGLFTALLFITLVPIYTWYFMVGFDKVVAGVREYLPGSQRPRIERILKEIDAMLRAFFRGRIVVVGIISAATTIVYMIFGVQYAVLLGLMSGLGVLIPYFSIVVGWIPAIIVLLVTKEEPWGAIIGMSIGFHVIQALEQYVITPKLLGDAVELHPITLLVGVFVMGSLFGLFGALLAVPLTAIAKTLGREFVLPYFKSLAAEKPKAVESS